MLPGYHPSYPTNTLPGLPFISPYQINLMQQAAVQMAFANQMSSMRAKETASLLSYKPVEARASPQQSPTTPTSMR